jgi:hypothetical protein
MRATRISADAVFGEASSEWDQEDCGPKQENEGSGEGGWLDTGETVHGCLASIR